ncbi:Homogentisate phytyltransferase 1, chloroplastic [Linum grandiflorum]
MESLLLLPSSPQPPSSYSSGGRSWMNDALKSGFPKGVLKASTSTAHAKLEGCSILRHKHHQVRAIKERCFNQQQRSRTKLVVNATSGQPLESEPGGYGSKSTLDSLKKSLDAFYRFSRPHTVIGTALSIVSVSLLSVEKLADISPVFCTGVLEAVAAALMMNIYIVGLNQLTDIEIDKVNKPYLPLASGEYSVGTGVFIVASFSIMVLVTRIPLFRCNLFLRHVLTVSVFVRVSGLDLPLLRWKRFAFVAALCILAVRAVIVQICFYLHMQMHVFGRSALFSRPLIFATAFMSFFSVVIALFKDIPDMEGDKIFGIKSFTVQLGQKRVFWTCIALLEIAYGIAMLVGAASPFVWSKCITVVGHTILAFVLWNRAKSVDLTSKAAITSCYMFVWKLFYAEYLLIPLVR